MEFSQQKRLRIKITELNPHLICKLCNGYLVNPVTITECIHTFCKSCLIRHISLVNCCPSCNKVIHESQPLYNIRSDRAMQDIINKIFPRLEKDEKRREKRFYKSKGVPYSQPATSSELASVQPKEPKPKATKKNEDSPDRTSEVKRLHHSAEQISLQLEYESEQVESQTMTAYGIKELDKKFIRCSTHVTIGLLQRFLATKLNLESENVVGITHDQTELDKDFTLKYISDNLTSEEDRCRPLLLQYKAMEIMT